ncbi:hypothetical protein [Chamaesiphon minutus]|uniref:Uncharacterized protein n=1 Tax=Chamaesiphon minutus (strain ATCC 27169 / PCC 6605) TaxID=1173020 RepID=K9UD73_CHAP6|nr:hypothetical protein [Chamaesiphon minutus]AFY92755.1 hypothetical protein Cha6605_1603 [Chamaesiphon minutus PCC 6605]
MDLTPTEPNRNEPHPEQLPTVDLIPSVTSDTQVPKSILLKITAPAPQSPSAKASVDVSAKAPVELVTDALVEVPVDVSTEAPVKIPAELPESKPAKSKPPKSEVPKSDVAKTKPVKDESGEGEATTKKPAKDEATKSDGKNKNWNFLLTTTAILAILTLAVGASRLIFQQKTEIFKHPSKIPNLTNEKIDKVIESGVRLDEKVTLAYIRSKLSVTQFQSQERKYTVFRIIAPETCGKLGCLYIVKPDDEGMPISLQLEDIGVGKEMFKASPKFHCFKVIQRQDGEDRHFEICEQGY